MFDWRSALFSFLILLKGFPDCVFVGVYAIPGSLHPMHHYESASSKVISSFLTAGRSIPGTRMTARELLARQSLARQSLAPITPDFFTPNPRRFKGKSRAGIGVPQVDLLPDELKQECARTWVLNTVFWERLRFEGAFPRMLCMDRPSR